MRVIRALFVAALIGLLTFSISHAALIETSDGAFIFYEVKGEGPPILLVHGWTMSHKFWKKQVEGLSQHYKVITMDLRGHGNSGKTIDGHTIPRYAKDVRTVIDALKLKNVTLVGWSLGGPVVLSYWEQFGADKVKALGLVDMTPFPFSPADWNSHGLKNYNFDDMNKFFIALEEKRREAATGFINKMFKSGVAPKDDLDWMLTEHLKTPEAVAVAIYSDNLMRDHTPILKKISVPTIVFAADSGISPKGIDMGRYVSSQIRHSTLVPMENAGHVLFYEQAEAFNAALEKFLQGLPKSGKL